MPTYQVSTVPDDDEFNTALVLGIAEADTPEEAVGVVARMALSDEFVEMAEEEDWSDEELCKIMQSLYVHEEEQLIEGVMVRQIEQEWTSDELFS